MSEGVPGKDRNLIAGWHDAPARASERRETRRRALILAAGRAFGRRGFHNTTLDDIAAQLSVTKPMLYRYVRNKHEILYECHRIAVGMAEEAYEEALRQVESPLERIRRFSEGYITRMTSELGTCVVLTEYYSMTPEHNELIERRRRVLDAGLRQLVQQAVDAGEIEPCDPKLAVFFFMGAINNINRWFTEGGPLAGEEIAVVFSNHIINGLRPTREGARPGREASGA
ncbi:MAG: TetR family transcriptional regulator [Ectothiorhodospiraceae bacterium]|nr:TetR family transcriptional regulator [Ectothiorhodospiraceae bacterium]